MRRLRDGLDLSRSSRQATANARAEAGQTALEAAASIHLDIACGFIRCETISTVTCSRRARTRRRRGAARSGWRKTYVVQDGDVLNIRFNVWSRSAR